jgi:hypothetical protein
MRGKDQVELGECAREIEARRTGVYHATPNELKAIDEADRSVWRVTKKSRRHLELFTAREN